MVSGKYNAALQSFAVKTRYYLSAWSVYCCCELQDTNLLPKQVMTSVICDSYVYDSLKVILQNNLTV